MVSQIESEIVSISYAGERYYLGFSDKFFAIYDKLDRRGTFTEPVQIFPKTQEAWEQAWHLFSSWEPHCRQIPTKIVNVTHSNEMDDQKSNAGMGGFDRNYSRPSIVLKSSLAGQPTGRYQPISFVPVKNPTAIPILGTSQKKSKLISNTSALNYRALMNNLLVVLKAVLARVDDLIQNPSDAMKYQLARFNNLVKRGKTQDSSQSKIATVAPSIAYSPAMAPQRRSKSKKFGKSPFRMSFKSRQHHRANQSKSAVKTILLTIVIVALIGTAIFAYSTYRNDQIAKAFPAKAQTICSGFIARVNPLAQQINTDSQSRIQLISDITSIKIAQADAFYALTSVAPQSLKSDFTNIQANLSTITATETNLSNAIGASNAAQIAQIEKTLAQLNTAFNSNLVSTGLGSCATASI